MPINADYPDVARLMVRADPEFTDPIEGRSQNHEHSLTTKAVGDRKPPPSMIFIES